MPDQHRLDDRNFAVILLRAESNKLDVLAPLAPDILAAFAAATPGEVRIVRAG